MNRREALKTLGLAAPAAGLVGAAQAAPAQGQAPAATASASGVKYARINGADLAYSIAGEDQDHPMILLHGGRGQGSHTSQFASHKVFGDQYRVIGFDMRGHGRSSVTGPFTFDQIVEDIEELRRTLGGNKKMVLSGGSFGGFIALSYAVKYPQNLSHLVLRGTAPSYRHEQEAMDNFRERAAARAPAATPAMLTKVFTPTIVDDEEFRMIMFALAPMYLPEGVTPDYDAILERCRRGTYRAKVHNDLYEPETWHRFDVVDQLKTLEVPTLVICGESDWICDPAQSRLMHQELPNSRLVIVPGADHSVPGDILVAETRKLLAA